MTLSIIALNCTLKAQGESSTDLLLKQVSERFEDAGPVETVRVAALNILPGVTSDEGPGDDWPALRAKIVAADILLLGTPIWMGQPGSVVKRVLERMDAFLGETDEQGRTPAYGKVAGVVVVGNEDGAHHVSAELFQALSDVGYTIPAGGPSYWVGEAMGSVDYKDLPQTPEKTATTSRTLARNCAHLARLLKAEPYPGS